MDAKVFAAMMTPQFEAVLSMIGRAVRRCPEEAWETPVGTWPLWRVAMHVLGYTDLYAAPSPKEWAVDKGLFPGGKNGLYEGNWDAPVERAAAAAYAATVRDNVVRALEAETEKSLAGPTGFSWVKGTRAGLYVYNLRHAAHHAGQLTAALRRADVAVGWVMEGWSTR